ncbi:MAG: RluA family pseudouridine synthase [Sulfurimonadaceae bacterium]|jgi:23S rRNA pseudouridine1911/1915/1917 synthase|nr:RluA family pseudouridine synthase [Sulfurimonadaceae bacterium]
MEEKKTYLCLEPQRLDLFLAEEIGQSRSQVVQLIKQSCVYVDNKLEIKPSTKLKSNQNVTVIFPGLIKQEPYAIDFDVAILYEDDDLLVVNKPHGITVHPAPSVKEATVVDWLKAKGIALSDIGSPERDGIVHRIDKGTSGAMVIAKSNEAHAFLAAQLQDQTMGRYYLAVVTPPLKEDVTIIEHAIGRNTTNRLKMACLEDGKDAKTLFKSILHSNDEKNQLLGAKLFTGRTHQIRVHLESMSRHILGDLTYAVSPKVETSEHILLHAYIVEFIHPRTKEKVIYQAPLSDVMQNYLEKNFNKEQLNEVMDSNFIIDSFNSVR